MVKTKFTFDERLKDSYNKRGLRLAEIDHRKAHPIFVEMFMFLCYYCI